MKKTVGAILIVFAFCAGAASRSPSQPDESPDYRLGKAVGGVLCSLTFFVAGVVLFQQATREERQAKEKEKKPDGKEE